MNTLPAYELDRRARQEALRAQRELEPVCRRAAGAGPEEDAGFVRQGGFIRVYRTMADPAGNTVAAGVYRAKVEENEDGEKVERWLWFASPIDVEAVSRNAGSEDWGRLLVIHDPDGVRHEWPMPMSLLAGRGDEFRARLLSLGAAIAPWSFGRNSIAEYVQLWRPAARARCVDRCGWYGETFVLPGQTFGPDRGERVLLQVTGAAPQFDRAGTLEDWQAKIARLAVGNGRLVFALSCAFAGPLLHCLGEESGGFHLSGQSSTGKTSALRVAASVWGRPHDSWRTTDNAAEAMARGASDTLLCLDEISQADARAVDAITYMIGNGAGKARMRRDATARPVITWRVMFLSTGEKGLGDKLAEIGRRAQAGQAVRAVEIPADAGAGLGLFEDLHDYADADALVRHLRLSADALKGTAGLAFLEKLTAKLEPNVRAVIEARNLWLDQNTPPGADGQVRRVAGRFALVAAVGKLAAAFKILPWPEGEAERAASACFGAWLAQRGGTGPAEIAEGIAQVRAFLEAHGSHRFERAWERHANGERAPHRLGFRRAADDGGGWTYFILPEAWKREVCKSFDATAIARAMAERDWLAPGDGRNLSVRQRIPGEGHRRVYIVRASFLAEHAA